MDRNLANFNEFFNTINLDDEDMKEQTDSVSDFTSSESPSPQKLTIKDDLEKQILQDLPKIESTTTKPIPIPKPPPLTTICKIYI